MHFETYTEIEYVGFFFSFFLMGMHTHSKTRCFAEFLDGIIESSNFEYIMLTRTSNVV